MKWLPFVTLFTLAYCMKPPCGTVCKFKLCNAGSGEASNKPRRLSLRPPLAVPNGPLICLTGTGDTMGRVLKTGEPVLELRDGSEVKMSKWRPDGLTEPFVKKFFLAKENGFYRRSVVVKKGNKGNQQEFLDNLCVRLPIRKYEVVKKKNRDVLVKTVKGGGEGDCLAFETRTMGLLVELNWGGKDDLDLLVEEPGGEVLSRFNRKTEFGKFGFDTSERCFKDKLTGKESAFYKNKPQSGVYKVIVRHFENCDGGFTDWNVRISVDGVLLDEITGSSDKDFSQTVLEKEFTL